MDVLQPWALRTHPGEEEKQWKEGLQHEAKLQTPVTYSIVSLDFMYKHNSKIKLLRSLRQLLQSIKP